MVIGFLAGLEAGGAAMLWYQKWMRRKELRKAVRMTEDILSGKKLKAVTAGEELLLARMEHQLIRVQEMLEGRRKEAERSRDEIQKLISEIAHQMRTPLANIESYTGFLREDLKEKREGEPWDQETDRQYVSALEESERKLHFLVESFVKMARLEQRVIQVRKEEADLVKTVQNTFGQIQNRAEEKEIRFDITLPDRLVCRHDPNWLGEAVFNILDNAVKYSSPGGRVEVVVRHSEMYRKLMVRDYGIGIDPGEEGNIFQRFYRGRRVTSQEGFGIGLYLAREIVDQHGGFLTARRMEPGLLLELNLPG